MSTVPPFAPRASACISRAKTRIGRIVVMPDEIVALNTRTDTSREAARMHVEVLRRLGIGQRAAMTFELIDVLRCVTEAGIRHRHPGYDNEMVRLALIRLWLGSELFRRIHPAVEIDP